MGRKPRESGSSLRKSGLSGARAQEGQMTVTGKAAAALGALAAFVGGGGAGCAFEVCFVMEMRDG